MWAPLCPFSQSLEERPAETVNILMVRACVCMHVCMRVSVCIHMCECIHACAHVCCVHTWYAGDVASHYLKRQKQNLLPIPLAVRRAVGCQLLIYGFFSALKSGISGGCQPQLRVPAPLGAVERKKTDSHYQKGSQGLGPLKHKETGEGGSES